MNLQDILGYQLDMARHAAMRNVYRELDGLLKPADTTALLLVRDQPGCDQATLGRALSGNRSVGMKVASRLEARGLMIRMDGRDRRTKSLYITEKGESLLKEASRRHLQAEAKITAYLEPGDRETLIRLLQKVQQAVHDQEAEALASPAPASRE